MSQNDENDEDYDDNEDEEDEELPQDSHIQLGYIDQDTTQPINQLFLSPNWKEWDGGCVGGKPVCEPFTHFVFSLSWCHLADLVESKGCS
jgi:hypothetical protein